MDIIEKASDREYKPPVVGHPADTIYDYLMEDPQKYLGRLRDLDPARSIAIIEFMAASGADSEVDTMTEEMAEDLEKVFESSKEFWMKLDANYREWLLPGTDI